MKFLNGLWYVAVSWVALAVSVVIIGWMLAFAYNISGPAIYNPGVWIVTAILTAVLVTADVGRLEDQRGIKKSALSWGIAVLILAPIFLPIYLYRRNETWLKE